MEIGILGTGTFGIVLGEILAHGGHAVSLWSRNEAKAKHLTETRQSPYHPGHSLSEEILVHHDLEEVVRDKRVVILAVPFASVREVLAKTLPFLSPNCILLNCPKGIEDNGNLVNDIYHELLPSPILLRRAVFLGGPSVSEEMLHHLPTAVVISSGDSLSVAVLQQELSTDFFRVYTSDDVPGVNLGGALASVYGIGAGISDGLGLGENCRTTMIVRGLAEMERLGVKVGAHPLTIAGLSGTGDLLIKCTSHYSRDRKLGIEIGKGRKLKEIQGNIRGVVEGIHAVKSMRSLIQRFQLEMPIAEMLHQILFGGKDPRRAVHDLMDLAPTSEPE